MRKEVSQSQFESLVKYSDDVTGTGCCEVETFDYWYDGEYLATKEGNRLYKSEVTGEYVWQTKYYTIN